MHYQAVLFDLDGTLVDSIHDIAAAANHMLVELGYDALPTSQITSFVGRGVDALIWQCLLEKIDDSAPDPEQYQQARTVFAKHYHKQLEQAETPIFEQVIPGLDAFRDAGCKLAVVTNKPIDYTHMILEQTGLAPYFQVVIGGDSCEEKKPHPLPLLFACAQLDVTPEHSLMIGDSINDVAAANDAQIDVLVLPYGYNQGEPTSALPATAHVDDLMAAYQWAQQRTQS